jgi:hypothetical protein
MEGPIRSRFIFPKCAGRNYPLLALEPPPGYTPGLFLRGLCIEILIPIRIHAAVLESRSMDRAGDFLGGMLRQLKRPEAAVAWLKGAWPNVVGGTIAAHTRPVRYSGGCLEVATDGKPWQIQLETMSAEFCAQVNRSWGGNLVREIRFVPASMPRHISHEFNNDHTPFVRRRKP